MVFDTVMYVNISQRDILLSTSYNFQAEPPTENQLVDLTRNLPSQNCWMIFMLGGGHMAAAVFKGKLTESNGYCILNLIPHEIKFYINAQSKYCNY